MYNQFENPFRPRELAEQRKAASDIKNNTDDLTFEGRDTNKRAAAYKGVRDLKDDLKIIELSNISVEDEMLKELEELESEYING